MTRAPPPGGRRGHRRRGRGVRRHRPGRGPGRARPRLGRGRPRGRRRRRPHARRPGGGQHRRPGRGPALPPGLVLGGGRRAQGRRGQPGRRRRDGRGARPRCWSGWPARRTRRPAGWRGSRPGWPPSARRTGPPSSAGTPWPARRTAASVVLSVTALGDLQGRAPVARGRAPGPGTSWRWPAGWAGRRAGWRCCAAASPARWPPVAAHRRPDPALRGRAGGRRRRGHRDVRRERRPAGRRRAPGRGRPGCCSTWTGQPWRVLRRPGRAAAAGGAPRRGGPAGLGAHRRGGPRPAGHLPGRRRPAGRVRRGSVWCEAGPTRGAGRRHRRPPTSRAGLGGGDRACPLPEAVPAAAARRPATTTPGARSWSRRCSRSTWSATAGATPWRSTRPSSLPPRGPVPGRRGGRPARRGAGPGGCTAPGRVEVKRMYVGPALRRRGLAQTRADRAGGHRGRGRPPARWCSTPATGSPRRWRSTPGAGYTPVAGLRRVRLRARRGVPGQGPGAARGVRHGRRDGVGDASAAAARRSPRPSPSGWGCRSTTGSSRPRWPGGSGCRSRRRRPTTRPSCAGCGGWWPRWARCPTRSAGCCRPRRCPTSAPTGSRPSGWSPRSPTGAGGVVLGRAAALVLGERPDALHVRLDGPERPPAAGRRGAPRPARGRGPPRDGGQRPHPVGLRAALLPLRPGRGPALPPGDRQHGARPRRSSTWSSWPPARGGSAGRDGSVTARPGGCAHHRGAVRPTRVDLVRSPRTRRPRSPWGDRGRRGVPRQEGRPSAAGDLAGADARGAGVDRDGGCRGRRAPRTDWMFGFQRRGVRRCE